MPEAPQWARVRGDMNCYVRRGAWYEVLRVMPEDVVLDVNRQPVRVERASLEIVARRPRQWSVVPRPRDSVDMPMSWGSRYAVCPGCSNRQELPGHPTMLQCTMCGGAYAVAWDDAYRA